MQEKLGAVVKNTTTFTYEPNDLLKTRTHDRQFSSYTYDGRDLPSTVSNGKTVTDPSPKVTRYTYTPRAQVQVETKANGNTVDAQYYLDGLLRHQIEKKPSGTVVNEHTITYDANSNRLTDVGHKQNADNTSSYLDTTATYAYDPLDRIRSVTKTGHGAGSESYVHDANHNVISQTVGGKSTTFTYDRNRLVSSVTAAVTSSYEYDPYGRLARVVAAGTEIEKYVYDGFDRTVSHTTVSGGTTTYAYDPLDRQISRTHGGKTTTLSYLGLSVNVLAEEENGQLRKSYQYRPGGGLLSQVKVNADGSEESSYYGFNQHSDVEQLTDQNGDARATYGYTAYGKNDDAQFTGIDKPDPANPEDPNKEPYNVYRFNAKRFDQATGDYDMGFRDYDPGLNRFLARDAYQGALADLNLAVDPFTQNRYAFAGGNPITNIELDGHIDVSWGEFMGNLTGFVGGFASAGSEAFQGVSWWTFDSLVGMSPFVDDQTHAEAMARQEARGDALRDPAQLWNNMTAGYREDMANGNDARVAGRAAFDLSILLIPGGAATKTTRATTAARTAQAEAAAAKAALPPLRSMMDKTVAAGGGSKTLSGWKGRLPQGFSRVDPAKTLAHEHEMGHPVVRAGGRDHGVPGQFYASHAERQAAMLHPNAPVGVSEPMCGQCVTWFSNHARFMGRTQIVADPFIVRVFRPNGKILEYPR